MNARRCPPPGDRDANYWAAIARDSERQTVDAVTRLADAEMEELRQELATVRDTLRLRTEAHGRLAETIDRVRAVVQRGLYEDEMGYRNGAAHALHAIDDVLNPEVTA